MNRCGSEVLGAAEGEGAAATADQPIALAVRGSDDVNDVVDMMAGVVGGHVAVKDGVPKVVDLAPRGDQPVALAIGGYCLTGVIPGLARRRSCRRTG